MFTWTHALVAWPIGRHLHGGDKDNLIPIACFCGAIIPDVALIVQIGFNWAHGRRGEDFVSPLTQELTWITHSIPVWLAAWVVAVFLITAFVLTFPKAETVLCRLWGLFIGASIAHIALDALTHKGLPFSEYDYLWPWYFHLGSIFGIWTYRFGLNTYVPRWPEAIIDVGLILWIVWTEFVPKHIVVKLTTMTREYSQP